MNTLYIVVEAARGIQVLAQKSEGVVVPEILEVHENRRAVPCFASAYKLVNEFVVRSSCNSLLSQSDVHGIIKKSLKEIVSYI